MDIKHIDLDICILIERDKELSNDKVTLGSATVSNGDNALSCKTLELPWNGNIENISCISTGIYRCKKIVSPSLGECFAILGVPYRTLVRGHAANFTRQILGCVAFGMYHADIDNDGIMDVTSSKATFKKVMAILPDELMLEIV